MSKLDFKDELNELLHISHAVGGNERLIQGGGGNTSVKCADDKSMIIKASGTPLWKMDRVKGWVVVDMEGIRGLFKDESLAALDPAEREKRVLANLYASVVTPENARPSVETPLHAMLDRVVIHVHPFAVNAVVCHPEGERIINEICKEMDCPPPLWMAYCDPGATLAFAVAGRIEKYRAVHRRLPAIIMQQNHGVFVSTSDPVGCIQLLFELINRIEKYFSVGLESGFTDAEKKMVESAVRKTSQSQEIKPLVRFSTRKEIVDNARSQQFVVFLRALTPDHVVYTGPCALIVENPAEVDNLEITIREYKAKWNLFPRLVLVRGRGMAIIAENEGKLDAAESMAVSAAETARLTSNNVHFINERDTDFIMNWEAEHYRAKQG